MRKNMKILPPPPLRSLSQYPLLLHLSMPEWRHGKFSFLFPSPFSKIIFLTRSNVQIFSLYISSFFPFEFVHFHIRALATGCETDVLIHVQGLCFQLHKVFFFNSSLGLWSTISLFIFIFFVFYFFLMLPWISLILYYFLGEG